VSAFTWLFLIHQLPAEPAYLRVKTLRRLKALGAVALKSSVYVLPDTPAAREDFHWLRREIIDGGGDATLCAGDLLEGTSDDDLQTLFRAARDEEYGEITAIAGDLAGSEEPTVKQLRKLQKRLEQVRERDHFDAPGHAVAAGALIALERAIRAEPTEESRPMEKKPTGASWVTRQGVHVDRMASAWLIRRFIDRAAEFKFVVPDGYRPLDGELRFDMFEGEFSHEGDRCTFETLIERFDLREPGLAALAEIIHDIDCKDDKFGRPETAGIAGVVAGIAAGHPADPDRIEAAATVLDALLEHFGSVPG
jgi:hypothetical protein